LCHTSSLFGSVIFQTGCHVFARGKPQITILLHMPLCVAGISGVNHHGLACLLRWTLANFLPRLTSNHDFCARVIGVNHHVRLYVVVIKNIHFWLT
jgi:hypothetical protein